MANSRRTLAAACLLLIAALGACGREMDPSDPDRAELEQANLWLRQIKAEDPDTGSVLAQECQKEVGFWLSRKGALAMSRCMRRKYDEGVRA